MAHYAFVDNNNIVTEVIVGKDENEIVDGIVDWQQHYEEVRGQKCLRTSYNTKGGIHIKGGTPYRGNYAGIGFKYDKDFDVFIPPQPYPSWKLNYTTFLWEAPIPIPDSDLFKWRWSEYNQEWIQVAIPTEN